MFISICEKHGLVDVWRHHNPDKRQFTWMRCNPNQGARLEMFFVSDHLSNFCFETEILPGYRTDHNIISTSMQVGEAVRGPGLWKFNESLLDDDQYVRVVERCIEQTIEQYAIPVYTKSFLLNPCNYMDIAFQIRDDLFYETLLMMIRGETVKFAKQKAKRIRESEKRLEEQTKNAHLQHCEHKTERSASSLQNFKNDLENLRKPYIAGLIVRSRTKWHEEGERSSKYFLSLEKRNALRKSVTILKVEDHILTRTSSILEAFTNNSSGKYNKQHMMPPFADVFIDRNVSVTLNEHERNAFESPLTYDELINRSSATYKERQSARFKRLYVNFLQIFLEKIQTVFIQSIQHVQWIKKDDILPQGRYHHDDTEGWKATRKHKSVAPYYATEHWF